MTGGRPAFAVDGHRLTPLTEGPERLTALLTLIGNARQSLRLLFYIYADDASGRAVADALAAAAARGVAVRLIVDGFGSDDASDDGFFDPLRDAGVAVCRFSARPGRRYLLRNHQKLALADGETDAPVAIVGGFNVEDDYFGAPEDGAWRDLGMLVEGPAAARIAGYYDALEAWIRSDRPTLRALNKALGRWSETDGTLRWLIGGPTRRLSPWARALRADFRRAERIDVVAGYFVPSPTLLRRLDRAGRTGRAVRIVTAAKSDNTTTVAAARFTYRGLLKRGVRIWEYGLTKLHTKLYLADDTVYLGSANMDLRSLFINLELMLRIEDEALAGYFRAYVDDEIAESQEITPALHRRRAGLVARARQFLAYLVVGVVDPSVSRGLNLGPGE